MERSQVTYYADEILEVMGEKWNSVPQIRHALRAHMLHQYSEKDPFMGWMMLSMPLIYSKKVDAYIHTSLKRLLADGRVEQRLPGQASYYLLVNRGNGIIERYIPVEYRVLKPLDYDDDCENSSDLEEGLAQTLRVA